MIPGAREPGEHGQGSDGHSRLLWSLFQIWYASPLPFYFEFWGLNTQPGPFHPPLPLPSFWPSTAFPHWKRSPHDHIPIQDWILATDSGFQRRLSVPVLR